MKNLIMPVTAIVLGIGGYFFVDSDARSEPEKPLLPIRVAAGVIDAKAWPMSVAMQAAENEEMFLELMSLELGRGDTSIGNQLLQAEETRCQRLLGVSLHQALQTTLKNSPHLFLSDAEAKKVINYLEANADAVDESRFGLWIVWWDEDKGTSKKVASKAPRYIVL